MALPLEGKVRRYTRAGGIESVLEDGDPCPATRSHVG